MDQVAGDQRPSKQELAEEHDQKTPGNARAHAALRAELTVTDQANDAKDERSIANRLDKAKPQNDDGDNEDKPLPTEIARSVRRGARCDLLTPISTATSPPRARRSMCVLLCSCTC